jgi:muconolactone delta-isomerase
MRYLIEFYLRYQDLGERREQVIDAELARTAELCASGMVIGEWRRADARGAVAVWDCPSHDVLNETLRSLPIWPYLSDVKVTPLIDHPSFPGGRPAPTR